MLSGRMEGRRANETVEKRFNMQRKGGEGFV
jgi:hypothetical protein